MTAAVPRLFCSRAFRWFEPVASRTGRVHLCCSSWLGKPIGDLRTESALAIWNGAAAQEIRASIHDGSFRYCDRMRCPYLQTVAGPVRRIGDVDDQELRDAIARKLTILPYGPREINCAYDRSCNLSCPSCRTGPIIEKENERDILGIQHKIEKELLRDAHHLNVTGSGDPFGSPYFRRWLQTMRREDAPELRNINLHTNALLWTPGMWSSIPEDIRRLIGSADISIDAASPGTYATNRRGGDFQKLLDNLEFIGSLRRQGALKSLTISMVVQANNFREMPDFVRLGRRFDIDGVYFKQLVDWGTFSDEEFAARAVHLPGHPDHPEFLRILGHPLLKDVPLENLTYLLG